MVLSTLERGEAHGLEIVHRLDHAGMISQVGLTPLWRTGRRFCWAGRRCSGTSHRRISVRSPPAPLQSDARVHAKRLPPVPLPSTTKDSHRSRPRCTPVRIVRIMVAWVGNIHAHVTANSRQKRSGSVPRCALGGNPRSHRSYSSHLGSHEEEALSLVGELLLAVLPTATVLLTLGLVKSLGRQHLLCATLASSALLIYLDPEHETNAVRTLLVAQLTAAGVGWALRAMLGPGFASAGTSMTATIVLMILRSTRQPPRPPWRLRYAPGTPVISCSSVWR